MAFPGVQRDRARLSVAGLELEVVRRGAGRPLLLLHGFQTISPDAPFLDRLARHAEILAPSHPGFGDSPRPANFETVYDLVHLYLEVLETSPHERMSLMGLSFGGWLAAEIAVKAGPRIDRLVLVDALGIKVSDRETPDILDVFNAHPREVRRRSWHAPEKWAPRYDDMADERADADRAQPGRALPLRLASVHAQSAARAVARTNQAANARHVGRLGRRREAIVRRGLSRLIPGSRFQLIPEAGHHPEIEQPEIFADRVSRFLHE